MSQSFETRCNALESYCGSLETELKTLQQKYTDLEKSYTALQEKVAMLEKNPAPTTPNFGSTSSSAPSIMVQREPEYAARCSRCKRGTSGQQTMQVWDGRTGQHVTKKSTLCDSCQRGSVVMF